MPNTKQCYQYEGPVYSFDRLIARNWNCQTVAVSEARARANLAYRYKQIAGLQKYARITLPGKLVPIQTAEVITLF